MDSAPSRPLGRVHLTRLMKIWRSAGWPCRDPVEIDLIAAGCVHLDRDAAGHETLRLTALGLDVLAQSRARSARKDSPHDRLARRVARQLMDAGRVVWLELPLRAQVEGPPQDEQAQPAQDLWTDEPGLPPGERDGAAPAKATWRMARPDVFSVRNTTVEAYLHPVVHEIKVSRADLLSDMRHEAKRQAYQWLCAECCYVFPAGTAQPEEIPEPFGVWLLHGGIDEGRLEIARPARHTACRLPFDVWMALAKAAPLRRDDDPPGQADLGAEGAGTPEG